MPKYSEKEMKERVKKNTQRVNREWAQSQRSDSCWKERRKMLEGELLNARPHLADQKPCGLVPDADPDQYTKRRVKLPNGLVIHSAWYKVPTTEADHKKAMREARWLHDECGNSASKSWEVGARV